MAAEVPVHLRRDQSTVDDGRMGKVYERIDGRLRDFIEAQHIFFTATAPLAADGTVNLSPKGLTGSLAVIDESTVAYLDFATATPRPSHTCVRTAGSRSFSTTPLGSFSRCGRL